MTSWISNAIRALRDKEAANANDDAHHNGNQGRVGIPASLLSESKDDTAMKSSSSSVITQLLHGLVLLCAFALLMAGEGFSTTRPGLAAGMVFVFSLPYLAAAIATRTAYFLYANMLLGALAYFMLCFALGAPFTWFPLLSVPLVACLWVIGRRLKLVLDDGLIAFSQTTFRAMNITVAVFAVWAFYQSFALLNEPGMVRYVAGLTFLGYAILYMTHTLTGNHSFYTYVSCLFLAMGACFSCVAGWSVQFCWVFLLVASALMVYLGTRYHRDRTLRWSRHFFICFVILLLTSLVFSLFRWSFILLDLALCAALLWQAYQWFARAVGGTRGATTNERLIPRLLLLGVQLLCVPVALVLFIIPGSPKVVAPAVIAGVTFAWIAWERRKDHGSYGNVYVLLSVLFLAGGIMGAGDAFFEESAGLWSLVHGLTLFAVIGFLYKAIAGRAKPVLMITLAQSSAFLAFFWWYVPLLSGDSHVALLAALSAFAASAVLGGLLREKRFLCAMGASLSGVLITAAEEYAAVTFPAFPIWGICAAGAAIGGTAFLWADSKKHLTTKDGARSAWLILTIAAPVYAWDISMASVIYSLSLVGAFSIMMMGWQKKRLGDREVFGISYPASDVLVTLAAIMATLAVVMLLPFSGLSLLVSGLCLIGLAAAYGAAWGLGRGSWCGDDAAVLFALGAVLSVFGLYPSTDARLIVGSLVLLMLFAVAAFVQRSLPRLSISCAVAGHLTSVIMACVALFLAWPANGLSLAVAAMFYALIYGIAPRLRTNFGFRLGLGCWLSLSVLLFLAAVMGTAYHEQMLWVAALAAFWLIGGYKLARGNSESYAMPMYMCATALALFASIVSLIAPSVAAGNWPIYLVAGFVFAVLFLILKEGIFEYLVTVTLSLMAYDWVRLTTTHFTQDLFVLFLIGVAGLGVFFLIPYLKPLVVRTVRLPLFPIFNWQGGTLLLIGLLAIVSLMGSIHALKATTHPKFCVACHNMDRFYESWQHSSHKEVACLECHYDPGVTGHVKGKMGAMVQLSKYATELQWLGKHAYSPAQPHAIIQNASCERSGCHTDMKLREDELLFAGRIKFRHAAHLGEDTRGKEVNCVSCHGQAVKGQHISVTATTCLTCHFCGRGERPVAVGDCTTCHTVPHALAASGTPSFDHEAFFAGKDEVRCESCHSRVTNGEAAVSKARCRSCHLEDMGDVGESKQFHLVHVSQEHLDCLQCHDRVEHGLRPRTDQMSADGSCGACHGGKRHTIQEQIYAGTAVSDLDVMPDFMYAAGVACGGCHIDDEFVESKDMTFTCKSAGAKACSSCHADNGYGEMLTYWQEEVRERIEGLEPKLADLEDVLASTEASSEGLAEARDCLESSKAKLSRVVRDGSFGAHNYFYVTSILDSAESDLEACQTLAGQFQLAAIQELRP